MVLRVDGGSGGAPVAHDADPFGVAACGTRRPSWAAPRTKALRRNPAPPGFGNPLLGNPPGTCGELGSYFCQEALVNSIDNSSLHWAAKVSNSPLRR